MHWASEADNRLEQDLRRRFELVSPLVVRSIFLVPVWSNVPGRIVVAVVAELSSGAQNGSPTDLVNDSRVASRRTPQGPEDCKPPRHFSMSAGGTVLTRR